MKIFLIRHGDTPWTVMKRYQGTTDLPLNAEGMRQAKAIARALRSEGITRLFTSTLQRAQATAQMISQKIGVPPTVDSRLNEIHFGEWEGVYYERLANQQGAPYRRWREGKLLKAPGGESVASLSRRIGEFIRELLRRHSEETVAVVSHGGAIKMLLFKAILGTRRVAPLPSIWAFRIDPASISFMKGDRHLLQIIWINRTDHLRSASRRGRARYDP